MALFRKHNRLIREDINTGFGNNAANVGTRLVNRDGTPNTIRKGLSWWQRISWYHTMIRMRGWKFILVIFSGFLLVNIFFATIYFLIGPHHLNGIEPGPVSRQISQVFFFSIQTYTTVGYGHISPDGAAASSVAAIEAFCGLLSFAIATGLFYGRFSRPVAYLKFSHQALIAPYKDGAALMFRTVPYKNNQLSEAEVKLNLAMMEEINGTLTTRFFPLEVEISKINSLVLSWTVVHHITESSPLYGMSMKDIEAARAELMVYISAFDETFSNMVVGRTSYRFDEWVYGAKFVPMYQRSANEEATLLELDKLSHHQPAHINTTAPAHDSNA